MSQRLKIKIKNKNLIFCNWHHFSKFLKKRDLSFFPFKKYVYLSDINSVISESVLKFLSSSALKAYEIWRMDSLSLKIRELKKKLPGIEKKLEEDREKYKKLELEVNQVEMMKTSTNCFINHEIRIVQESRTNLKKIHDAYQDLSTQSTSQHYQYLIMNRVEELYQEKEKFESQLGYLKLKRGIEEEKLEEIKMKVTAQNVGTGE